MLNAIQNQRFRLLSTQNKADFIHLLKAADSISLDVGTDYLEQFLQLPDVQKIITEKLTPENLARVTQKALENEQSENSPNFPKTIAEADKIAANRYLASDNLRGKTPEGEIKRFDEHIKDIMQTGIFSLKTDATSLQEITTRQNLMLRLGRVMLRQQGMNPGSMQLENGRVQFEMDVPDKEPIFHGMRQEQGLSIAQQEEMKKKQEAEQQQQQEQERLDEDREEQTEINNQHSKDAQKKREDEQKASEENSKKMSAAEAFMQQVKKRQPQQTKSNSFLNSLRANTENTNRTNLLQSQNQSNTCKRSKGMGMSR